MANESLLVQHTQTVDTLHPNCPIAFVLRSKGSQQRQWHVTTKGNEEWANEEGQRW